MLCLIKLFKINLLHTSLALMLCLVLRILFLTNLFKLHYLITISFVLLKKLPRYYTWSYYKNFISLWKKFKTWTPTLTAFITKVFYETFIKKNKTEKITYKYSKSNGCYITCLNSL